MVLIKFVAACIGQSTDYVSVGGDANGLCWGQDDPTCRVQVVASLLVVSATE